VRLIDRPLLSRSAAYRYREFLVQPALTLIHSENEPSRQPRGVGLRYALMTTTPSRYLGASLVGLLLLGCNDPFQETPSSTTTTTGTATGLWTGTDSVTGETITGLIASTGQAVFIRNDGAQFDGTVQLSGTTVNAAVDGYTNFFGSAFSDGSTSGVGTLTGTLTSGSTLTLTLSFTTGGGTALTGSWSLSYSSLSSTVSALTTIGGNYSDTTTNATVSISDDGAIFSQNPANSCVLNGAVSVINAANDIYGMQYTYSSCTGSDAVLNGVSFSGLAVLNSNASPAQIVEGVTGTGTGTSYGIVTSLNAT
jgi:hypothetical protein